VFFFYFGDDIDVPFDGISIPGQTVTWVGEFPFVEDAICLGTEKGLLFAMDQNGKYLINPQRVSPSSDTINGIAFSNLGSPHVMAASTPTEISIAEWNSEMGSAGSRFIYNGGAHGVAASPGRGFVAPLGPGRLLHINMNNPPLYRCEEIRCDARDVFFYKVALLTRAAVDSDIVAVAGRSGGLMSLHLKATSRNGTLGAFRAPGVDIIDICAIGDTQNPNAVAGLALDSSLHLTTDISNESVQPLTLRFSQISGAGYSIRSINGDIFVMTEIGLYAIRNLARDFLANSNVGGISMVRYFKCAAFDLCVTHDKWIFLLLPDEIHRLSVSTIWEGRPRFENATKVERSVSNQLTKMRPMAEQLEWQISFNSLVTTAATI
jgi:hypothetical protein